MANGKNIITLQGSAITINVRPKAAFITLYIRGYKVPNFPRIAVFDPALVEQVRAMKKNTHITVEGYIRANRPNPARPNAATQTIVATSIHPTESSMMTEFGIETSMSYKPFENKYALAGTIVGMECTGRGPTYITIRAFTEGNNRYNNIQTVYYGDASKLSERFHLNMEVAIRGLVQTNKTVKDKTDGNPEIRYYENFVVSEILPIEAAKEIEKIDELPSSPVSVKIV